MPVQERRRLVEPNRELSIRRQCHLLGLPLSTFYHKSMRNHRRDERLMKVLDQLHLEDPTRGTRRLTKELNKLEHDVGRDNVRSLMARMNR